MKGRERATKSDQADFSASEGTIEIDQSLRGFSLLVAHPFPSGAADDTVFQGESVNRALVEQVHSHASFMQGR
jgi:hypothetical protein